MSNETTPAVQQPAETKCGWMKLWHPRGVQVSLPVAGDYAGMFAAVDAAFAAGWLADAPGLEAGEEVEEISHCVKSIHVNKDGTESPMIDLYAAKDALKYSVLRVYLDTVEQMRAFEAASGIRFHDMPKYEGVGKLERGNRQTAKFFSAAPRPFKVVYAANPAYSEEDAKKTKEAGQVYKVAARKFVRWGEPAANCHADSR